MSGGRDLRVKEQCDMVKKGNSSIFVELRGRSDRTTSNPEPHFPTSHYVLTHSRFDMFEKGTAPIASSPDSIVFINPILRSEEYP